MNKMSDIQLNRKQYGTIWLEAFSEPRYQDYFVMGSKKTYLVAIRIYNDGRVLDYNRWADRVVQGNKKNQ